MDFEMHLNPLYSFIFSTLPGYCDKNLVRFLACCVDPPGVEFFEFG